MPTADLHMHTTLSDGTFTIRELISHAAEKELDVISITDHDRILTEPEAWEEAKKHNITLIPGIEISSHCDHKSIHILGYFIDKECEIVKDLIKRAQQSREDRNHRMIEKFQSNGIDITMEKLVNIANGDTIARPHFATALVELGLAKDIKDAFNKFISDTGPYFVEHHDIDSEEVISAIKRSGGISSLAHPHTYKLGSDQDIEKFIKKLADQGLDAIEGYYSTYKQYQRDLFAGIAKRHGLMLSGGSDFHGANKPHIQLGHFEGKEQVFENFKDLMKEKGFINE